MIWDLLLLGVTLCYLVNLYFSWHKNYWLRKGFPFVEPLFFFGNIRDVVLMRKTIGQAYKEIYEKLGSKPLGGFFKLREPILMLKHPDLIRKVLVDEFESFQSNDIHVRRDANPLLKLNPLLASGAKWRSMKSLWSPHWDKALVSQSTMVRNVSQKMVSFLKSTSGEYIEGKELSRKFVSDVIASWAIGVELDSFHNPNVAFRIMSDRIVNRNFKSTSLFSWLFTLRIYQIYSNSG
uniref:Cytochrome P450 6k1 n=1 Tax=Lygus hesperus TaxID=30085 RepID=A0A0A9Y9E3_LYGHE